MADNLNTGRLQMTDETFRLLRDFIYEHSGIFFPDNKKPQLENRLSLRIKANNLPDFEKYYYMLKYDPQSPREIRALFDSVTTNETSFFRSPPQIQAFQEKALPEILHRKAGEGDKTLRLWSAGCSTGDEPYTLGMVALDVLAPISADLRDQVADATTARTSRRRSDCRPGRAWEAALTG